MQNPSMSPGAPALAHAPLQGIDAVVAACAATDPVALFAAIDAYARPVLGQTLCTVNRFDADRIAVVRLYSSDPVSYPPGGSKQKAGTRWGQHVLLDRKVYVGEGEAAIRESFDDHAAILSLGLKSVINVPVVAGDVCLGTLNLLMPAERVGAGQVAFARLAGLMAVPGFLAMAQRAGVSPR
ncbi:GAF domain-containing protein [Bordetella genomosp. 9]|uniref:GAF domain-containing protein n=1 Tax=Bordetella genomosp. 9 TaxID=1416803 RepID=UPI000A295ED0|nr:GAF domain-containing protein [Bordetella genomosp. 9]ARP92663.1 GAF domain-containing protein [Bordetella genomosp. 9]